MSEKLFFKIMWIVILVLMVVVIVVVVKLIAIATLICTRPFGEWIVLLWNAAVPPQPVADIGRKEPAPWACVAHSGTPRSQLHVVVGKVIAPVEVNGPKLAVWAHACSREVALQLKLKQCPKGISCLGGLFLNDRLRINKALRFSHSDDMLHVDNQGWSGGESNHLLH